RGARAARARHTDGRRPPRPAGRIRLGLGSGASQRRNPAPRRRARASGDEADGLLRQLLPRWGCRRGGPHASARVELDRGGRPGRLRAGADRSRDPAPPSAKRDCHPARRRRVHRIRGVVGASGEPASRGDPPRRVARPRGQSRRLRAAPRDREALAMSRGAAKPETWYLFSVNVDTPPTMTIDSGQEVTLVVRGAFADVRDIRDVPTPFTPACDGHPLAPIAGPVHIHGAEPGDAVAIDLLEITPHTDGITA